MSFTKVSVAGIGTTGTITFTNVNVAGVITATSFSGSGANLTGVASTDNIRTNTNATFLQSVNVTGIVTTAGVNASGIVTATSSIVGSAVTINASGINATGVITATSFSGSGANLTGLAATANVTTSSLVVIGVSTVAAGTTAAPSISPTGDSNTGIFFPSADTIAFGEGGVEAFRIDSSGNVTINNGNLVIGTSGKGIDFSATANSSGTMSSELLDDYEEGTWTPTDGSGAGLTFTFAGGRYVKIGRIVHCWAALGYPATSNSNYNKISNFPFVAANSIYSGNMNITNYGSSDILPMMEGDYIQLRNYSNGFLTNAQVASKFFYFEFNISTSS